MSRLPLQQIIDRYDSLNQQLMEQADSKTLIELSKAQKKLQPQFELASLLLENEKTVIENDSLASDPDCDTDMAAMLNEDSATKKSQIETIENQLLTYLTPADERDDKDILLEIRAGAGGDESSLFAGEILRSYSMMAQKLGLNFKVIDSSPGTVGGYKEVIIEIKGLGAFSWFKYEGGVHRVQRVPETEKQGRVHTSTIAVAIMPLIENDSDFQLDMSEVEVIASTSQGAGGQSVNTTYSAIQALHKPTGIRAQSQDERNQQQNKVRALQVLTSRVADFYEQQRLEKEYNERKDQVGTMDRSEKVRTYNFPQDRLTDHRYNHNWNQLPGIMSGGIMEVIEQIKKMEAERNLEKLG